MKTQTVTLVNTADEAVKNIHRYNDALAGREADGLKRRITASRAWYAVEEPDGIYFGPSKWIGYNNLDVAYYEAQADKSLDGRMTEKRLGQWGTPVPRTHGRYNELYAALSEFCALHGASPNSLTRISLISATSALPESQSEDETIHALMVLINGLSEAGKRKLKRLI